MRIQPIVFSAETIQYIAEHNQAIEEAKAIAKAALAVEPDLKLSIMKEYNRTAHRADMEYERKMASRHFPTPW